MVDDDPFGYMAQLAGYEEAEGTEDGGFFAINKETGEICLFRPGQLSKPNIRTKISNIKDSLEVDEPPSICYPPIAEGKKGNLRLASGCVYCPPTKLSAGRTLTMEAVLELLNILTALNILPE